MNSDTVPTDISSVCESVSSRGSTSWIYDMLQRMDANHTATTERIIHTMQTMSDRIDKMENTDVLQSVSDKVDRLQSVTDKMDILQSVSNKMDILQSVSERVLHSITDMNTRLDNIARSIQSCEICTQSVHESVTCVDAKLCGVDASITQLSSIDNNMGFHSVENNIMIKRIQSQIDEIHDAVNNMNTTVVGVIDSKLDETACIVS